MSEVNATPTPTPPTNPPTPPTNPPTPPATTPTPPPGGVASDAGKSKDKTPQRPENVLREVIETVVFVVVLVFLLKTFVAEAFVIPTGSMAETLYGYQKIVTCPQCGYTFPVNCSSEVETQPGRHKSYVRGCTCPNCGYEIIWANEGQDRPTNPNAEYVAFSPFPNSVRYYELIDTPPPYYSGDRVLVAKFPYEFGLEPNRFDVVVFKFPDTPQLALVALNYIKRLLGLPTETIAIYQGNIYRTKALTYKHRRRLEEDNIEPRSREAMFVNDPEAVALFEASVIRGQGGEDGFQILRKSPNQILAMRRIVFDNDYQPKDLLAKGVQRWQPESPKATAWTYDPADPRQFRRAASRASDAIDYLRYQHIVVQRGTTRKIETIPEPGLITNTMGYNSDIPGSGILSNDWCGDLILECQVKHDAAPGKLILEVSRGVDRFQARFDLPSGECSLVRLTTNRTSGAQVETVLASQPTKLGRSAGRDTLVRLANVDDRLTLWVGSDLPFGEGVPYKANTDAQPYDPHDKSAPARIGVSGPGCEVSAVQLWRDTYYTRYSREAGNLGFQTLYVQPDHYLCLGDNSSQSSDSREWGTVPRRLLLGRAVAVYWPTWRLRIIR